MRKYNLTQAKVYIYDKATGKMVEKPRDRLEITIEGAEPSSVTDSAGNTFELHGPPHTWEELRAIADKVYPKTVDELQKALLEEARKLSADNK